MFENKNDNRWPPIGYYIVNNTREVLSAENLIQIVH